MRQAVIVEQIGLEDQKQRMLGLRLALILVIGGEGDGFVIARRQHLALRPRKGLSRAPPPTSTTIASGSTGAGTDSEVATRRAPVPKPRVLTVTSSRKPFHCGSSVPITRTQPRRRPGWRVSTDMVCHLGAITTTGPTRRCSLTALVSFSPSA
jgi:hypothetical protein